MPKVLNLDKFVSLNNVSPELGMQPFYLTKAENVYINSEFKIKHSPGLKKVINTPSACHSLKSFGSFCLFVSDGTLYRLNADKSIRALCYNNMLVEGRPVDYVKVLDRIFLTNGLCSLVYDYSADTIFHLGIPLPQKPLLSVERGGYLPEGSYRFKVSYVRSDDVESGLSDYAEVAAPQGSKIIIHLSNVNNPPEIKEVAIYATKADSAVFRFLLKTPVTNSVAEYSSEDSLSDIEPVTIDMEPLPTGETIEVFNGRLWTSVVNNLYFSELYAYELCRPTENFIPLPDHVLDLYSLGNIMYINCVDGIYVINKDLVLRKVGTTPFIRRSGRIIDLYKFSFFENPMSGIALIALSKEGLMLGLMDGELINLTSKTYRFGSSYKYANIDFLNEMLYITTKT